MELRGGCLCGVVRFIVRAVSDAGYCHCSICRRHSGAPVVAWAQVPEPDFELVAGEPATYESSEHGRRAFCSACGSVLWFRESGAVSINICALDEPNAVSPAVHICIESQLGWFKHGDFLPAYEGTGRPPPAERKPLRGPANPEGRRGDVVTLREVGADNLGAVLFLAVNGPQRRFVATNAMSLAQGMVAGNAWIRAIYAGDVAVGFAMAEIMDKDELGLPLKNDASLWRFMIDERYQGLGFGRRSLDLVVAELSGWPGVSNVWLGAIRGVGSPYEFYIKCGFVDTGVQDPDGEWILRVAVN